MPLLTAAQASAELGIPPATLRDLVRAGKVPFYPYFRAGCPLLARGDRGVQGRNACGSGRMTTVGGIRHFTHGCAGTENSVPAGGPKAGFPIWAALTREFGHARCEARLTRLRLGAQKPLKHSIRAPALLTAGGKTLEEVAAHSWDCHDWTNCPMAFAFGVKDLSEIPAIYQREAELFVALFDARAVPNPITGEAAAAK